MDDENENSEREEKFIESKLQNKSIMCLSRALYVFCTSDNV